MASWIVVAILLAVAAFFVVVYNSLVSNRQLSREVWARIDVQLKRS